MARTPNRLLAFVAVAQSAALCLLLLGGADDPAPTRFSEITAERINIVEPDGALRMVISNHDRLPGVIVRGEETPLDRPQAGMLFLNDEASEIGGLIFGGRTDDQGRIVNSGASLSFDKYEANQIVQLIGVDDHENRFAGLSVTDCISGTEVYRRIWVGRGDDGVATIALMDPQGRKRIVMAVDADGAPSLSFLDDQGEVIDRLAPSTE
ncbi:MAG: hypothetical protein ACF8QF_00895 [Phycisphaerales bacterium]